MSEETPKGTCKKCGQKKGTCKTCNKKNQEPEVKKDGKTCSKCEKIQKGIMPYAVVSLLISAVTIYGLYALIMMIVGLFTN